MNPTRRSFLATAASTATIALPLHAAGGTEVSIRGADFLINGRPTYQGRRWKDVRIEGLLMNSRMVQGTFDDENPETVNRWVYPDTGKWDPERNTREFLAAMPEWRRHGLLGFTVNFQGGSPQGYSKDQPWLNNGFNPDGTLKPAYLSRMKRILDRADELGMVAMVGYFYFGQDEHLDGDAAVRRATENATRWLLAQDYRHVLVEVANECNVPRYEQPLIQAPNIHELIEIVKAVNVGGRRLLVSASYGGRFIPLPNVVKASDYLLLHGNGVKDPAFITEMVERTRQVEGYRPMPVVFNEDDHFDFDRPVNNFVNAVRSGASWGYFDPGESNYRDGYQCPPVQWGINTERKKQFFNLVKEMTGA